MSQQPYDARGSRNITPRFLWKCPKCGDQTKHTAKFTNREAPTCGLCLILRCEIVELVEGTRTLAEPVSPFSSSGMFDEIFPRGRT